MEKSHRPLPNNRRDILFGLIAAFIVIADQIAKWAITHFVPENTILWDLKLFRIIHITNTGVSFGLFKGYIWFIVVIVFIEMAVILYAVYLLRTRLSFLDSILMRVGAGLVMGGAIGNQIDRIIHQQVTDFIDFKIWPVWNVADMGAVIGTIIIAYCILFKSGLFKHKNG